MVLVQLENKSHDSAAGLQLWGWSTYRPDIVVLEQHTYQRLVETIGKN